MRHFKLGLLILMAAAPVCTTALREDELACEQAVAQLERCCPSSVTGSIECVFRPGCPADEQPDLGLAESRCIQELDCEQMEAERVCERVADAGPKSHQLDDASPFVRGDVCP